MDQQLQTPAHNDKLAPFIAGSTSHLAEGETYAGLSRDHETGVWHHIVLLPGSPEKELTWKKALDWAKSVGGDLPTRFEAALLYANLRDQFSKAGWYWTADEDKAEPAWAWIQNFFSGSQISNHTDNHFRARAVRRVPV